MCKISPLRLCLASVEMTKQGRYKHEISPLRLCLASVEMTKQGIRMTKGFIKIIVNY